MSPDPWERKTIGELCEFTNGKGFRPSDWSTQGLPIVRIQNLNGSTEFNYFAGVPDKRWLVMTGDLLFAWAGTKGVSFGPTLWNGEKGVLNQHIYRISPNDGVDKRWLYYALKAITARVETKAHGFKSTLLHVHKSEITDQVVSVPPPSEQEKIAKTLIVWERAVERTEKLIATKASLRRGLRHQLLTGKKRFQKFVRDEGTQPTRFGTVPSDWHYLRIGDVAREVSEKNPNGQSPVVLSCTKHRGLVDSLAYFGKRVFSQDTSTYKVVRRGQFAYATNHIEEGSIGYQDLYDEALISPMYTVFETNGQVNDSFFYKLLKTELYRHTFEVNTSASVDRRGSLRWKEFAKIKVALPSLKEQRDIATVLHVVDKEIELLRNQLDAIKRQKRGLMLELVTGHTRVKVGVNA